MTTNELQFLNEFAMGMLKSAIQHSYEFDCPEEVNPKSMDRLFNTWQKYRKDLIDKIRANRFVERHKLDLNFRF